MSSQAVFATRFPARTKTKWGWGIWAANLLILSTLGMSLLIDPGRWMASLVVAMVVFSLVGMIGQRLSARWDPGWQTVIVVFGILCITLILANRQVAAGLMTMGLVPNATSMTIMGQDLLKALGQLITAQPPVPEVGVFAPLLFIAYGLLAVVVVTAAVVWEQPGPMIVMSLAPWMAVFSMRVDPPSGLPIVTGVVMLLFVLWAGTQAQPVKNWIGARYNARGPLAIVILTVATALALLATMVGPSVPHWGNGLDWLRSLSQGEGQGGYADPTVATIGVGGDFDLNGQLQSGHPKSIMTINGTYHGPLMVDTLTDFNGRGWAVSSSSARETVSDGKTIWPSGQTLNQKIFSSTATTEIRFLNTSSSVIPLGTGPRVIQSGWSSMTYNPLTDQLLAPATVDGSHVKQAIQLLDRSTLVGDPAGTPPDQNPAMFLYVRETSHTADLSDLAAQLTNGLKGDYNKLIAIQMYLKSEDFTYTLKPVTNQATDDAVWDFLQRKTGYCVHFATAMIVLGRLAGIPMRGAVGYVTPRSGSGTITSQDAHMWPQAYFRDAGWVDFDPTPSSGSGAVPTQSPTSGPSTSNTSASVPVPSSPTTTSNPNSDTLGPLPSPSSEPAEEATNQAWPWLGAWLGAVLLIAGVLVAVRLRRISRYTPERAWTVITHLASRHQLVGVSATPRTVVQAVGTKLNDEALDRLRELAEVIEERVYGPPGSGIGGRPSQYWYDVQKEVVSQMRHRHAA